MSSSPSSRLEFIESLRLLAATLVFLQHALEGHHEFDSLTRLAPGVAGVVMFFIVSGYVVPMSVRKGLDPLPFMIRRVFRIYPLLLFAFAVLLVGGTIGVLANWRFMTSATPGQWAANLLLIQEYVGARPFLGVSWTLSIEFVWYILFAVSLWRFGDRAGGILSVVMPVALLGLTLLSLWLDFRIPLGRFGMIYACVLGYQAFLFDSRLISGRRMVVSIAAFLAVTWFSNIVAFGVFKHSHISLAQALGPWTVIPLVFFAVTMTGLRNARWLNSGWVPACGAASYSIYLLHPIGLSFAHQYGHGDVSEFLVGVAATGLMAFVGYKYVERPGIALGRKLVASLRSEKASPLPAAQ